MVHLLKKAPFYLSLSAMIIIKIIMSAFSVILNSTLPPPFSIGLTNFKFVPIRYEEVRNFHPRDNSRINYNFINHL